MTASETATHAPGTVTHAPGTFCWLDLSTHDAEGARRFYPALFGWSVNDMKYGEGENEIYTMYQVDGKDVAASSATQPEQQQAGVPSFWLLYVAVEDADQAAARAQELGGTLLMPPFDVLDAGRMAMVQDPTGATFALWQAKRHKGFGLAGQTGTLCWGELATTDPARAGEFYTSLFGWTTQPMEGVEMPYTIFTPRGAEMPVGGMYQITPEMGGMPSNWAPYFAVENADATAARAGELGGTVVMEPMDIPMAGRAVLLQDPQGAMFYAIKLAPPSQS